MQVIQKSKMFLYIFALLVGGFMVLTPSTVYAEPAKCIVFDTGSNLLSSSDDVYSVVDCESSAHQGLRNFEDDKFYKINITPIAAPQVVEMTQDDYTRQVDIIGGGNGELPGEGDGNFEGDCKGELDKENCGIVAYIVQFTNILSGLVGIVIVIMIAVGGIQYTTARDDPQAVSAAKNRIRNAILALVFYLFAFAFLQYLIPGGIF